MAVTSGADKEQEGFSSINVTPLTDVLLVLLIIFLITGNSITAPAHDITLPEVITKEKAENASIFIDVDPKGDFYVGNSKIEQVRLEEVLGRLARVKNTDRVIINADNKTPYKSVVIAMNSARKSGLVNIALATDYDEENGKGEAGSIKIVDDAEASDASKQEGGKK